MDHGELDVCWSLVCDDGHAWDAWTPDVRSVPDEVARCPEDGAPAVTAMRLPRADRPTVVLVPAARRRDGRDTHDDEVFLELRGPGGRSLRTPIPIRWEQAVRRAAELRTRTWDDAARVWERLG
ncbi:hypothetical protein [Cellulomonas phragmiteti]|uniref:hypothetical protein n=1 Tax=Cellulomonas phragmiteti TaxID=478780 RepID=UPI001943AE1C|nr:hypothetical protein [Cellulomonas phragmiteti]